MEFFPKKKSYKLRFFGTGETATVSEEFIKPYTEKFIKLFNTPKLMAMPKHKGAFKAGVEQIAAAAIENENLSMAGGSARQIEENMGALSMDLAVSIPASDVKNSNSTESETYTDEAFMFKRKRPRLSSPKLHLSTLKIAPNERHRKFNSKSFKS